jgi:preprotein translocase subunit SecY
MTNLYGFDLNPYLFSVLVGTVILCIFLISTFLEMKYQNRNLYEIIQKNSGFISGLIEHSKTLEKENEKLIKECATLGAKYALWETPPNAGTPMEDK